MKIEALEKAKSIQTQINRLQVELIDVQKFKGKSVQLSLRDNLSNYVYLGCISEPILQATLAMYETDFVSQIKALEKELEEI